MNDISLDSASEALDMSPSYIGLVFRKVGGTSFLKYLTDIRMGEAKRLLRYSDRSAAAIGAYLGFSSTAHFSRVFKKYSGITPREYRETKG